RAWFANGGCPVTIGHLTRLEVHGDSVCIQIGFVMLSFESHKDITQNLRTKNVSNRLGSSLRCEGTLVQVVALMFKIRCVGFDLPRRDPLINAEPGPSGETNRHGFKAVVVAGHTT